jgi:hypothetical protein
MTPGIIVEGASFPTISRSLAMLIDATKELRDSRIGEWQQADQ